MSNAWKMPIGIIISAIFWISAGLIVTGFSFPLATPRRALSASFGEYRPGHLHAGIDFATFSKTGIPVQAVASGRVYRLRSSAGGYGNVVYIRHDDGRRSVYAHLESVSAKLEKLFPRKPHQLGGDLSGEAMEIYPAGGGVRVEEKEVIGRTGESGAGLPHFHFEFRDSEDRPINAARAGVIRTDDVTPPVLSSIILEPADENSSVAGGGFPIIIDSSIRNPVIQAAGSIRILVTSFDEDGQLGGSLGITNLKLFVDGRLWSAIDMSDFAYGRDKEVGLVYDLYRTGFSPTCYTYDLTGPDGAGEVLSGRGPVRMDSPAIRMRVEISDLAGNRRTFSWRLTRFAPTRSAGRQEFIGDGESISRGGLAMRRRGKIRRITGISSGSDGVDRWHVTQIGRDRIATVMGGARISEPPPNIRIYAASPGAIPAHPAAVGTPIMLGPYGMMLQSKSEIILDDAGNANGIAFWRNGSWSWLGGSKAPGRITASLPFLAPVVAVRDTQAPEITAGYSNAAFTVSIKDDYSGVEGSSVEVMDMNSSPTRPISGRYDSDRGAFIPDERITSGQILRVLATDRAGNAATSNITPGIEP